MNLVLTVFLNDWILMALFNLFSFSFTLPFPVLFYFSSSSHTYIWNVDSNTSFIIIDGEQNVGGSPYIRPSTVTIWQLKTYSGNTQKWKIDNQIDNQNLYILLFIVLMFLLVPTMRQVSKCWLFSGTFDHNYCPMRALQRLLIIVPCLGKFLPMSLHLLNSQGGLVHSLLLLDPHYLGWQGHRSLWKVTGLKHSTHGCVCRRRDVLANLPQSCYFSWC